MLKKWQGQVLLPDPFRLLMPEGYTNPARSRRSEYSDTGHSGVVVRRPPLEGPVVFAPGPHRHILWPTTPPPEKG
jgi:hypothetical protein